MISTTYPQGTYNELERTYNEPAGNKGGTRGPPRPHTLSYTRSTTDQVNQPLTTFTTDTKLYLRHYIFYFQYTSFFT